MAPLMRPTRRLSTRSEDSAVLLPGIGYILCRQAEKDPNRVSIVDSEPHEGMALESPAKVKASRRAQAFAGRQFI